MTVTKEEIIRIFSDLGLPTEVKDDVNFLEQGFDSIDIPRSIVAISKELNVNLAGAKGEQIKNMNLLLDYINSKK